MACSRTARRACRSFSSSTRVSRPALRRGRIPGAKQALIRIDVPHTRQQRLIQKRGFDCQFSSAKQLCKLRRLDRQRLGTGPREALSPAQVPELQPAEPARIDETQFASACEREPGMRMFRNRADPESSPAAFPSCPDARSTAQRSRSPARWSASACDARVPPQLEHDVLAGAVNGNDTPLAQPLGLSRRRCFEGFAMRAEPDIDDAVATYTRVDTACDCLYFRQFRHRLILEGKAAESFAGSHSGCVVRTRASAILPVPRIRLASKLTMRQTPRRSFTYTRVYR